MDMAPEGQEPPNIRFLRRLVTVLTAVMILGLITIIAIFVIRLGQPVAITLPDQVDLPEGITARAFTQGEGWFAIVTDTEEILIYAPDGTLTQRVQIGE